MATAHLIVEFPDRSADLIYAAHFSAPDPVIYFVHAGKKYLVLSDLELDRGRRVATVDQVLSLSEYIRKAKERFGDARQINILETLFRERKIRRLLVPATTSVELVDQLRARRFTVRIGPTPFYERRLVKTLAERRLIDAAQRVTFHAFRHAEQILRTSQIRRHLLYYHGKILTSEYLKAEIAFCLMQQGYATPEGLIVACGEQSTEGHHAGSGPLRPHQAIIIDIFPRSMTHFFWGDATRTYCRGKAPPALKKMYATVLRGQALGLHLVRSGVNGRSIHQAILKFFAGEGYETGERNGRLQGFNHGTGHGLGLEIHETPQRISATDYLLKPGHVFTIEPALYYSGIGGVRIEDVVYVTKTGCEILGGRYPRRLEIL